MVIVMANFSEEDKVHQQSSLMCFTIMKRTGALLNISWKHSYLCHDYFRVGHPCNEKKMKELRPRHTEQKQPRKKQEFGKECRPMGPVSKDQCCVRAESNADGASPSSASPSESNEIDSAELITT